MGVYVQFGDRQKTAIYPHKLHAVSSIHVVMPWIKYTFLWNKSLIYSLLLIKLNKLSVYGLKTYINTNI